ncbi:MAG TPA: SAM-dependent chlorinase/fluorinase, partial [Acidobacteriaceae bacterium]|nr:SAM-dependent chlorinase/fluorinase [Acidobacteriaceae bacterium]
DIMNRTPLISLTTDFGLLDPFVGTMKGVIASICPGAQVVDLTHGVEAFSILDGALAIWQGWRYFPADTIHVVVVDPGVGSERQAILSRMGDFWFIAPDNGVLTLVERDVRRAGGAIEHRMIQNPEYRLPAPSHTFHGRDIFAPAAAHLAAQIERGEVAFESFGPPVASSIQLPVPDPVHLPDGSVEGVILKADRFGNLLTNLAAADLPEDGRDLAIEIGARRITHFARFFAEAHPGELVAIIGSSGLLEIVMNRGSAREETPAEAGTKFRMIPQ